LDFIITKVDHKISNNDWETKISTIATLKGEKLGHIKKDVWNKWTVEAILDLTKKVEIPPKSSPTSTKPPTQPGILTLPSTTVEQAREEDDGRRKNGTLGTIDLSKSQQLNEGALNKKGINTWKSKSENYLNRV